MNTQIFYESETAAWHRACGRLESAFMKCRLWRFREPTQAKPPHHPIGGSPVVWRS
jgi:hypothetical protein